MSSKWTIREATLDDSKAIVQLHSEVYQEIYPISEARHPLWGDDPPSWWKWWNLDNPTKKHSSIVAEDAGRIVGHLASRYTWLNLGEKNCVLSAGD
ncbi:GNAT family N-acetyltransferase [Chloroflexota bacterium]